MGEPKESPSLRGESKNLSNFRGGILLFWVENWPKIFQRGGIFCQRVPLLKGESQSKLFLGGYPLDSLPVYALENILQPNGLHSLWKQNFYVTKSPKMHLFVRFHSTVIVYKKEII